MPSSRQARITRKAISPRFAIKMRRNMTTTTPNSQWHHDPTPNCWASARAVDHWGLAVDRSSALIPRRAPFFEERLHPFLSFGGDASHGDCFGGVRENPSRFASPHPSQQRFRGRDRLWRGTQDLVRVVSDALIQLP